MKNTVKCPKCDFDFELTEALKQQVQKQAIASLEARYEKEKTEFEKNVAIKIEKKVKDKLKLEIQNQKDEVDELKENNKELTKQLIELNKTLRSLQQKDDKRELQYQKQLNEKTKTIKEKAEKDESEKSRLEKAELEKKLTDTQKALTEAQRKAKQGSQQLQGEILELDLEKELKKTFPQDKIEEIKKGSAGADTRHIVLSPRGFKCGTILWESKRTKKWGNTWISKLKRNLREEGADIPVIVSEVLPDGIDKGIGEKEGVWICSSSFIKPLAKILRSKVLEVAYQKAVSDNKNEKSEIIYSFVTSHEFRQQVEAIVEVYKDAKEQIDKEKRAFKKQWSQRDAQLERILLSTANIYGKMQGTAGKAMPQIKDLEILQIEGD